MGSQKQIAEKLGLSRSLVSKVLSDRLGTTKVRPETGELIRRTARELDYHPNPTAVSLATGRTGTIAVLVRRFGHPASRLPDLLVDGITEELRGTNLQLILLFYTEENEVRRLEYLSKEARVDGLVLAGLLSDSLLENLAVFPRPVVAVHTHPVNHDVPRVTVPNERIGYLAARHLIDCGCRRIALIDTWYYRGEGSRRAMAEAGVPVSEKLVFEAGDFFHQTGEEAVRQFRRSRLVFDGIVAQSDEQAAGAINALLRAGVRVPEDVKVVGVDNSPFCEFCICPLTSVDQNMRQAGREALGMLMQLMADPQAVPRNVDVEPSLVTRRSTECSGDPA